MERQKRRKKIEVKGYTRSDGKRVKPYRRFVGNIKRVQAKISETSMERKYVRKLIKNQPFSDERYRKGRISSHYAVTYEPGKFPNREIPLLKKLKKFLGVTWIWDYGYDDQEKVPFSTTLPIYPDIEVGEDF